jgi:hypothetical protein
MTQTATLTAPVRSLGQVLAAPFVWFGIVMVNLAEASPRMKAINQLNAISDEDLAARGKTREEEVRRIFGASFYA